MEYLYMQKTKKRPTFVAVLASGLGCKAMALIPTELGTRRKNRGGPLVAWCHLKVKAGRGMCNGLLWDMGDSPTIQASPGKFGTAAPFSSVLALPIWAYSLSKRFRGPPPGMDRNRW